METVDLCVSHMVAGGDGLAREDSGRVVFVSGAIAGEQVLARITTAKKDFARAEVVDVLVPSPDRVTPPCAAWHRGCGGCDWQHIEPHAQLVHKTAIVGEALSRTARLVDPHVTAAGSVAPWGYRTTVRLAVGAAGVGFRSRRSHEIVVIDTCPIAAPGVNEQLAKLEMTPRGADEVTLRVSIATGMTNISTETSAGFDAPLLWEDIGGHRLRVSIDSFFQSSPQAAELLVHAVARAVADVDLAAARVIDAYGGVGLFAVTVAAEAAAVIVVEGSASACADARVNLAGREALVVQCRVEDWKPAPADVVIADPARSGLDKDAARVLAATGSPVIVLVSCDAGSLARDARLLGALGYEHCSSEVIDAFPNTSHIETVSRFVLRGSG